MMRTEQEVKDLELKIEQWEDKTGGDDNSEGILDTIRWILLVDDVSLEEFLRQQDMEI